MTRVQYSISAVCRGRVWSQCACLLLSCLSFSACPASAGSIEIEEIGSVTVLATRQTESTLEVPASVGRVEGEVLRSGAGVNLSEALGALPGLSVQNRGNYAQDLQISMRGFGARSGFGARGIRLYADGIPGTMPDGQGQYSHFDLSGADHVEVLRGPFSALYGNASGGVLAITTAAAPDGLGGGVGAESGSDGFRRYTVNASDGSEHSNWVMNLAHFRTEGYRAHSAASRSTLNTKWRWDLTELSHLTLVANAVETPFVEDPLGLTAAQLASDREQAGTNALAYNTRKRLVQQQAGATFETVLPSGTKMVWTAYAGHRHSTQFQAILKSVEALATHPGGVIDLDRRYRGGEWRLQDTLTVFGGPLSWTAGLTADGLDEERRGYLNFFGTNLGVQGALRRNETNTVSNVDEYLQAQWRVAQLGQLSVGVRHTDIGIRSVSHTNGNALTTIHYGATNPVIGLLVHLQPRLVAYASFGKGFETPTLNDLAYRSTSGAVSGLNTALHPARSDNREVGLKFAGEYLRATLAGFDIRTENELAVKANSGGRSVYENIGPTRRRGAELSIEGKLAPKLSGTLAYTLMNALTLSDYAACAATPCVPVIIKAGSALPAVPRNALYAALALHVKEGLTITGETVGRAGMYADDRNLAAVSSYWAANLRMEWAQHLSWGRLSETVRLDNVFDRRYVGSVIVNESNGRYYEPSAGRTALLMVNLALR